MVANDCTIELSPTLPMRNSNKFSIFVGNTPVTDFGYIQYGIAAHRLVIPLGLSSYPEEEVEPRHSLAHNASKILETGSETLTQRAKLRDSTSTGERSMAKAVAIFNAWQGDTGDHLTEEEGWRFMIALKQARMAGGKFHLDDYVDLASYSALLGEHLGDLNARSPEA